MQPFQQTYEHTYSLLTNSELDFVFKLSQPQLFLYMSFCCIYPYFGLWQKVTDATRDRQHYGQSVHNPQPGVLIGRLVQVVDDRITIRECHSLLCFLFCPCFGRVMARHFRVRSDQKIVKENVIRHWPQFQAYSADRGQVLEWVRVIEVIWVWDLFGFPDAFEVGVVNHRCMPFTLELRVSNHRWPPFTTTWLAFGVF